MRLLLVASLGLLSGCVVTMGERVPDKLGSPRAAVEMPPAIKLIFSHEHQADGAPQGGTITKITHDQMLEGLERVRETDPILARAHPEPYFDIQYLLFVDTVFNERDLLWAYISGASFLLIPVTLPGDVVVTGSLYEAHSGAKVGVYQSKVTRNTFVWLPTIVLLPVNAFTAPGPEELYDDTYRDMLVQLTADLEGREHPRSVPPSSVEVEEEPAHIQRIIRTR